MDLEEIIFPWIKVIKKKILKSFPVVKEKNSEQLLNHIYEELENLNCNNWNDLYKTEVLYGTLNHFYIHFSWKVNWNEECYLQLSTVQLLYYMTYVGMILSSGDVESQWLDKVLLAFKSFPGDCDVILDILLLIKNIPSKYLTAYTVILRSVLIDTSIRDPPKPECFIKVMLLLRRLKSLITVGKKKKKTNIYSLASKIKCPVNTINFLLTVNDDDECCFTETNIVEKFLSKKLKSAFVKKLFEVLIKNKYDERITNFSAHVTRKSENESSNLISGNSQKVYSSARNKLKSKKIQGLEKSKKKKKKQKWLSRKEHFASNGMMMFPISTSKPLHKKQKVNNHVDSQNCNKSQEVSDYGKPLKKLKGKKRTFSTNSKNVNNHVDNQNCVKSQVQSREVSDCEKKLKGKKRTFSTNSDSFTDILVNSLSLSQKRKKRKTNTYEVEDLIFKKSNSQSDNNQDIHAFDSDQITEAPVNDLISPNTEKHNAEYAINSNVENIYSINSLPENNSDHVSEKTISKSGELDKKAKFITQSPINLYNRPLLSENVTKHDDNQDIFFPSCDIDGTNSSIQKENDAANQIKNQNEHFVQVNKIYTNDISKETSTNSVDNEIKSKPLHNCTCVEKFEVDLGQNVQNKGMYSQISLNDNNNEDDNDAKMKSVSQISGDILSSTPMLAATNIVNYFHKNNLCSIRKADENLRLSSEENLNNTPTATPNKKTHSTSECSLFDHKIHESPESLDLNVSSILSESSKQILEKSGSVYTSDSFKSLTSEDLSDSQEMGSPKMVKRKKRFKKRNLSKEFVSDSNSESVNDENISSESGRQNDFSATGTDDNLEENHTRVRDSNLELFPSSKKVTEYPNKSSSFITSQNLFDIQETASPKEVKKKRFRRNSSKKFVSYSNSESDNDGNISSETKKQDDFSATGADDNFGGNNTEAVDSNLEQLPSSKSVTEEFNKSSSFITSEGLTDFQEITSPEEMKKKKCKTLILSKEFVSDSNSEPVNDGNISNETKKQNDFSAIGADDIFVEHHAQTVNSNSELSSELLPSSKNVSENPKKYNTSVKNEICSLPNGSSVDSNEKEHKSQSEDTILTNNETHISLNISKTLNTLSNSVKASNSLKSASENIYRMDALDLSPSKSPEEKCFDSITENKKCEVLLRDEDNSPSNHNPRCSGVLKGKSKKIKNHKEKSKKMKNHKEKPNCNLRKKKKRKRYNKNQQGSRKNLSESNSESDKELCISINQAIKTLDKSIHEVAKTSVDSYDELPSKKIIISESVTRSHSKSSSDLPLLTNAESDNCFDSKTENKKCVVLLKDEDKSPSNHNLSFIENSIDSKKRKFKKIDIAIEPTSETSSDSCYELKESECIAEESEFNSDSSDELNVPDNTAFKLSSNSSTKSKPLYVHLSETKTETGNLLKSSLIHSSDVTKQKEAHETLQKSNDFCINNEEVENSSVVKNTDSSAKKKFRQQSMFEFLPRPNQITHSNNKQCISKSPVTVDNMNLEAIGKDFDSPDSPEKTQSNVLKTQTRIKNSPESFLNVLKINISPISNESTHTSKQEGLEQSENSFTFSKYSNQPSNVNDGESVKFNEHQTFNVFSEPDNKLCDKTSSNNLNLNEENNSDQNFSNFKSPLKTMKNNSVKKVDKRKLRKSKMKTLPVKEDTCDKQNALQTTNQQELNNFNQEEININKNICKKSDIYLYNSELPKISERTDHALNKIILTKEVRVVLQDCRTFKNFPKIHGNARVVKENECGLSAEFNTDSSKLISLNEMEEIKSEAEGISSKITSNKSIYNQNEKTLDASNSTTEQFSNSLTECNRLDKKTISEVSLNNSNCSSFLSSPIAPSTSFSSKKAKRIIIDSDSDSSDDFSVKNMSKNFINSKYLIENKSSIAVSESSFSTPRKSKRCFSESKSDISDNLNVSSESSMYHSYSKYTPNSSMESEKQSLDSSKTSLNDSSNVNVKSFIHFSASEANSDDTDYLSKSDDFIVSDNYVSEDLGENENELNKSVSSTNSLHSSKNLSIKKSCAKLKRRIITSESETESFGEGSSATVTQQTVHVTANSRRNKISSESDSDDLHDHNSPIETKLSVIKKHNSKTLKRNKESKLNKSSSYDDKSSNTVRKMSSQNLEYRNSKTNEISLHSDYDISMVSPNDVKQKLDISTSSSTLSQQSYFLRKRKSRSNLKNTNTSFESRNCNSLNQSVQGSSTNSMHSSKNSLSKKSYAKLKRRIISSESENESFDEGSSTIITQQTMHVTTKEHCVMDSCGNLKNFGDKSSKTYPDSPVQHSLNCESNNFNVLPGLKVNCTKLIDQYPCKTIENSPLQNSYAEKLSTPPKKLDCNEKSLIESDTDSDKTCLFQNSSVVEKQSDLEINKSDDTLYEDRLTSEDNAKILKKLSHSINSSSEDNKKCSSNSTMQKRKKVPSTISNKKERILSFITNNDNMSAYKNFEFSAAKNGILSDSLECMPLTHIQKKSPDSTSSDSSECISPTQIQKKSHQNSNPFLQNNFKKLYQKASKILSNGDNCSLINPSKNIVKENSSLMNLSQATSKESYLELDNINLDVYLKKNDSKDVSENTLPSHTQKNVQKAFVGKFNQDALNENQSLNQCIDSDKTEDNLTNNFSSQCTRLFENELPLESANGSTDTSFKKFQNLPDMNLQNEPPCNFVLSEKDKGSLTQEFIMDSFDERFMCSIIDKLQNDSSSLISDNFLKDAFTGNFVDSSCEQNNHSLLLNNKEVSVNGAENIVNKTNQCSVDFLNTINDSQVFQSVPKASCDVKPSGKHVVNVDCHTSVPQINSLNLDISSNKIDTLVQHPKTSMLDTHIEFIQSDKQNNSDGSELQSNNNSNLSLGEQLNQMGFEMIPDLGTNLTQNCISETDQTQNVKGSSSTTANLLPQQSTVIKSNENFLFLFDARKSPCKVHVLPEASIANILNKPAVTHSESQTDTNPSLSTIDKNIGQTKKKSITPCISNIFFTVNGKMMTFLSPVVNLGRKCDDPEFLSSISKRYSIHSVKTCRNSENIVKQRRRHNLRRKCDDREFQPSISKKM